MIPLKQRRRLVSDGLSDVINWAAPQLGQIPYWAVVTEKPQCGSTVGPTGDGQFRHVDDSGAHMQLLHNAVKASSEKEGGEDGNEW